MDKVIISINKAYFSHYQPLIIRGFMCIGWLCEKYALLIEIIILSLFFFNHCHSYMYIAVHFLEMFFYYLYVLWACSFFILMDPKTIIMVAPINVLVFTSAFCRWPIRG